MIRPGGGNDILRRSLGGAPLRGRVGDRHTRTGGPKPLSMEPIEPRLLLNADLPGLDLILTDDQNRDQDILVRMVETAGVDAEAGTVVHRLEVIDLANGNEVLADERLDDVNSLTLDLAGGDDRVTLDLASFGDQTVPNIAIDGGTGADRLVLDTTATTNWQITGVGAGTAESGGATLAFSNMEWLTGADDADDNFVLAPAGGLAGGIDGGAGGYDTLTVQGSYTAPTATLSGAVTTLDLDGKLFSYTGIEPVLVNGGDLQILVLGTTGDDHVVLEDGPLAGQFQIRSANGSFATQVFTNSVMSVVLGLSTGNDSFTSTLSADSPFRGNVIIAETSNLTLGSVTGIDGSLSVDTFASVIIAAPGELNYDGSSIKVQDDAVIDITGDLSLVVNASDVLDASNLQEWISAPIIKGLIEIGERVSITARDVTAEVNVTNAREVFLGIDASRLLEIALEDARVAEAAGWGTASFSDNGDGTATLTRSSGSWLDDGFVAGQQLLVNNTTTGLNQSFRILSAAAGHLVLELRAGDTLPGPITDVSGTTIGGYAFTQISGTDLITFGVIETAEGTQVMGISRGVPVANPDATLAAGISVAFVTEAGVTDTLQRSSGTWAADGFAVGQTIVITGAGGNNGSYVIGSINGARMSLLDYDGAAADLSEAAASSSVEIRGHMVGSFLDEGFQAGDLIVVQNSAGNDNTYRVAEVGAYVLILDTQAIPVPETIDLSAADAPELILQKVNEDIALEDLPLVLMDKDGNLIKGADGNPLSFTQAELEAAYATQNDLRLPGSDTTILEDVVTYLVDNPFTDFLTGFGFRIIASTVSADLTIGQDSTITARGDVSLVAVTEVEADGSSPSVVAGLSIVYSKASANIDIASGVVIDAEGDVTVDARTVHSVTADSSVTSGAVVNPMQGAVGGFGSDTAGRIDPSFAVAFGTLSRFIPNVSGFVRIPGPAIAVAVGVIDTDTTITLHQGASVLGSNISVLANIEEVLDPADVGEGESRFVNVANEYGVSAGATIFQPGRNQGFGISVAVSVSQTDAIIDIQGDLTTHADSGGEIVIAAASVNDANSVGAASWVRNVKEGAGGIGGLLGDFQTEFSQSVSSLQNNLRDQGAFNDLGNENPGKVAGAAGIAVLVSHNLAEVRISGSVTADGSIDVAAIATDNPGIGASGATEPGSDIEISGGVAVAIYDNDAKVRLLDGAQMTALGDIGILAQAQIPNQVTIDDLIWGNIIAANEALDEALAAAEEIEDVDEREEAKAEARETYARAVNDIVNEWFNFPLDVIQNRRWGIFGVEGFLFTSYVNSGGGGSFASDRPEDQVTVLDDKGRAVLNPDGTPKTKTVEQATNSAKYVINGNVNILIMNSSAEVEIGSGVTVEAGGDLAAASSSQMESVNLTGLTSLYDIFWNTVGRFQSGDDDDDGDGAKGGFGASVGVRLFENIAKTTVQAGSVLTGASGDVRLTAATRDLHVNIHEIGADGGDVAVSGVVSVDVMSSTTEVLVDESVRITAGNDVVLDAASDMLQVVITLTGAETTGKAAVGAAVGVNVVNSTTRAMILDRDGAVAPFDSATVTRDDATIVAGGDVSIGARRGDVLVQIALAGSAKSEDAPDGGGGGGGGTEPDGIFDAVSNLFGAGTPTDGFESTWPGSDSGGSSGNAGSLAPSSSSSSQTATDASNSRGGVAAAGAVIVDFSKATVTAAIGAGTIISATGTVRTKAEYQRDAVMIAAGGALDTSSGGTAALAGAIGIAVAERYVDATITGAAIFAGGLEVDAWRRDLLIGVSVGGAGALRSNVSIAGSVNVHVFTGDVNAKVTGSTLVLDGDASIIARSDRLIVTVAGAVGVVGTGDAGVGAAIGITSSNEDVRAYLDDSSLSAGGNVKVIAKNEFTLASVVVSAGISVTGDGGAGQLALHLVTGTVDARIGAGSVVDADGHVAVVAVDRITMVTVTGGVALGGRNAVGIAAASTNIYARKVHAHVDDGASVTAQSGGAALSIDALPGGTVTVRGVTVKALADDDIVNVVVGVAVAGSKFAGQGSILIDTNESDIGAWIGSDAGTGASRAHVAARNGGDVVVDALHDIVDVAVVGGVVASLGGAAIGASIHVYVHHRTVTATIGAHALVEAGGDAKVDADLDATLRSVIFTGAFAVGTAAFGGAITVAVSNDFVTAQAMRDSDVTAGGDIVIDAGHELQQTVVDAALSGSITAGISASIGVVVQNATTKALVGSGAALIAEDTVLIDAVGTTALQVIAGGVSIGGKAGIGASGFVLVRDDKVIAETFTGAQITGRGIGDGVLRSTANDNRPTTSEARTETVHGVAVVAESWEDLIGIAIQGSVGGVAAVAGSLPISAITETTTARIGAYSGINQAPGAAPGAAQDLIVRATDDTLVVHVAGNLAISGTGSVGLGADITSIVKTTTAEIAANAVAGVNGAQIAANRNVIVEAASRDKLVSVAIGVAVGGKAGVSLNASIYVHKSDTFARIGANTHVVAEGSVIVAANQATDADFIVVSVSGGIAAAGAGVGVAVFNHTTDAVIGENAFVVAKGLREGVTGLRTGAIAVGGSSGVTALEVGAEGVSVTDQQLAGASSGNFDLGLPQFDNAVDDTDGMFADRRFSAATSSDGFTGLSVTATSVADLTSFSGVLAGGAAAVSGGVVVSVVTSNTTARIEDGARINDFDGARGDAQQVRVASGSAYDHLGIVVGAGVGGVAVLPVVHVGVADLTTTAKIEGAFVRAAGNISVRADAHQDMQSLGISLAGGGSAAVAPAVQVLDLTSSTSAIISGAADVEAGGNVVVAAADDTNVDTLGIALAGGGASVGAAISVVSVNKTTDAVIGTGASVTAWAGGGTILALSGETTSRADREAVRGVIVEAQSRENVDVVAAGGAGGGVAIGGSVAVQYIDSDTRAAIESGATVNAPQDGVTYGAQQGVHVAALNEVDLFVVAGGVALGGTIAAAGSVNVADIRNDTSAYLGGNVSARDKVSVAALSDQKLEGVVFAGSAGGIAGITAAIGVYTIGGNLSASDNADYEYIDENGNQQTASVFGDSNPQTKTSEGVSDAKDGLLTNLTSEIGGDPAQLTEDKAIVAQAASAVGGGAPAPGDSFTIPQGTTAFIAAGAVVNAGGGIDIDARQDSDINVIAGGVGIGLLGLGGGIGVMTIDNDVSAYIETGSTIGAGGDITITARLDGRAELTAFAGTGAIYGALAAGVSVIDEKSDVRASIGDGVTITRAGQITVEAISRVELRPEAIAVSVALGVGGAAAVVDITAQGNTTAWVGENTRIGVGGADGDEVGGLTVSADAELLVDEPRAVEGSDTSPGMAIGGAGGILAGSAGVVTIRDQRDTLAYIGAGSQIDVTEDVKVSALSGSGLRAFVSGGAGGIIAGGAMIGHIIVTSSTKAEIRGNADRRTIILGDNVIVESTGVSRSYVETSIGSGGFAGARVSGSTADVTSTSAAGVGENVGIVAVDTIRIEAQSGIEADTVSRAAGGGAVDVGVTLANTNINPDLTAESAPATHAFVGSDSNLIAGGDIVVRAIYDINVTEYDASIASVDPVANTISLNGETGLSTGMRVQYSGPDATALGLQTGRDYAVIRVDETTIQLGRYFSLEYDEGSGDARDPGIGIDIEYDVIRFSQDHGFRNGDLVRYVAEPTQGTVQPAGSALVDGALYTVKVIDSRTIKLVPEGMATTTVSFQSPGTLVGGVFQIVGHGFSDGDAVTYDGPDSFVIEQQYLQVRYVSGPNVTDPLVEDLNSNRLVLPGYDPLVHGTFLVYEGGDEASVSFDPGAVAFDISEGFFPENYNHTITIANHGFHSGDQVVYRVGPEADAAAIGGLTDGATYYVAVVDENTIMLALTSFDAIELGDKVSGPRLFIVFLPERIEFSDAGVGTHSFDYVETIGNLVSGRSYYMLPQASGDASLPFYVLWDTLNGGKFMTLDRYDLAADETHNFYLPGNFPIKGLVDGKTYYIVNSTADSFQLSATPGGTALDLGDGTRPGSQIIGITGADFTGTGTGTGRLVFNIAGTGGGELLGEGGVPLSEIVSFGGDGLSSAKVDGFGVSLGGGNANTATVVLKTSVETTIGAAELTTIDGDIRLSAETVTNGRADATTFAINLLGGYKRSATDISVTSWTTLDVGDKAVLTSGGDIVLVGRAEHNWVAKPRTEGGGLIDVAQSLAKAIISETNAILIGDDAVLYARGLIDVRASTGGRIESDVWISNGGLGAGAEANLADKSWKVSFTANNSVSIGENVVITADLVNIRAATSNVYLLSKADATTGGFAAGAIATATAELIATSSISIGAGAQLTGHYGVILRAQNADNKVEAISTARSRSFIGAANSTSDATLTLTALVTAAAGATIFAGPGRDGSGNPTAALLVEADNPDGSNQQIRTPTRSPGVIDFGSNKSEGSKTRTSTITWDADVVIHAGQKPRLVIDEAGNIVSAINVTVNGGTGEGGTIDGAFFVDDIAPTQYGWIEFRSEGSSEAIGGTQGTFYLLDTFSEVFIENRSGYTMTIRNIDVQADTEKTRADVVIDVTSDGNTLEFAIGDAALPTLVDIRQLDGNDDARTGDLILAGTIDNPRGEVILLAEIGNILSAGPRGFEATAGGVTRTPLTIANSITITALAGSIGANGAALNIDLVSLDILAMDRVGDPDGLEYTTATIRADASGDVFVDLRARERAYEPDAIGSGSLTQTVDHIAAGGEISVILQTGVNELFTPSSGIVEVLAQNDGTKIDAKSGFVETRYPDDLSASAGTRVFGDTLAESAAADTTYVFRDSLDGAPGLIAGTHIRIEQAAPIGASTAPRVNVEGLVDAGPDGVLDVLVSGFVELTENRDNMNVGRIESRYDDVTLTALDGSILDAFEDAEADVLGNAITLMAALGVIGAKGEGPDGHRSLDLDSRMGGVTADAQGDIYLIETDGNIGVIRVTSESGNVRIEAADGGIVVAGSEATQVEGTDIDLIARAGGIGALGTPFNIDSSFSGTGRLYALASEGIHLTETANQLNLLAAVSQTGDVFLRTPDTGATPFDGAGLGESLVFLTSGMTLLDEGVDQARISAANDVVLLIGDDVIMQINSVIESGRSVAIYGDHDDADEGFGTNMLLRGAIMPMGSYIGWSAEIFGNGDADSFALEDLFLGGATRVSGAGSEDLFTVQRLASMTDPLASDPGGNVTGYALTLDGQSGSDAYVIRTAGSQVQDGDGYRNYVINVLDSGAPLDGSDVLDIYGVDADETQDGGDIFLMRRLAYIPGEDGATDPGMVALLHGTLGQATQTADRPTEVERINYDAGINGRLTVHGAGGDDAFLVDDTTVVMTLDGGEGNDIFRIGQLFGSERDALAGLGAGDVFDTTETTAGWLSRGNSAALLVAGGAGDDDITVYSNKAALHLDGGAGNDAFTLRAFALAGEGLRYNVNAPVTLDGGDGFDKVIAVGTEFDDAFVITEDGVFGAGLSLTVGGNEEVREIDGMEGDDTFFALSTQAATLTRIIGNLGSDTVNVTSDVTEPIVSTSMDGVYGLITHAIAASGEDYAYATLPGLTPIIADPAGDAGLVVITESGADTIVGEDGTLDSYTIRLSRPPEPGETVYVTISAARSGLGDPLADTIWLATAPGAYTRTVTVDGDDDIRENRDLVLSFTADDWFVAKTVYVMAPDDSASEGTQTVMISHQVRSTDGSFDAVPVRNVAVTVLDNDRPELVIAQLGPDGEVDNLTRVLEGADGTGVSDHYDLSLSLAPAEGETVRVYLDHDGQIALSGAGVLFDGDRAYVEFTASDYDQPVRITVTAVDDWITDGTVVSRIVHSIESDGVVYQDASGGVLDVSVVDNETPGLFVTETGGGTVVVKDSLDADGNPMGVGQGDSYTIRLTAQPEADVTIDLTSDGQTDFVIGGRVFLRETGVAGDGLYEGALSFGADGTITGDQDWGALGFAAGQLIRVGDGPNAGDYKILSVDGTVLTLTGGATLGAGAQADGTITRISAAITFTPENFAQAVTVGVVADPYFTISEESRNLRSFANQPHDLNAIQGAVEVIGGVYVERSFEAAVILPGEINPPLPERPVSDDPLDLAAIDSLNVFDDGVMADRDGVLTGTNLSGMGMGGGFDFGTTAFGEAAVVAGGITYGDAGGLSQVEVLNLLMGQGNDSLVIESTLLTEADHGGITVIHGGGNRFADTAPDAPLPTVIGGDTITVLGGGGVDSPLVIFGDTSDDGAFYAGDPARASSALFGAGPVLSYPLASPFRFEGNDVIDASALFAGLETDALPAVGVSIHGGGGDDTIHGSQAGDHLTGGAGDDAIFAGGGNDHVYGDSGLNIDPVGRILTVVTGAEAGADEIEGGTGEDIIFGDHGVIAQTPGTVRLLTTGNVVFATTTDPENGADDVIRAGDGHDWVFGGNGDDHIEGGAGEDVLFGDLGYIDAVLIAATDIAIGGSDVILAGEGEDIVIGGARGDMLDGEAGDDLIFGDAARLEWTGDAVNPRFRTLLGAVIYDAQGNVQIDPAQGFVSPDNVAVWAYWQITNLYHDGSQPAGSFGDDYIAGGAGDDMIFGQLGDDVIQGDGSIRPALDTGIRVGAYRDPSGLMMLSPSFDADTDGDDYIEGNGGNDVIFGNLGQDDIVGGSSSMFTLVTPEQRPDGDDIIFGGSGNFLGRYDIGDTSVYGHARDADVILGDNGNIFRILHDDGSYRSFAHDSYTDALPAEDQLKIVVRGYELLDYTIGWSPEDIGGSDLVYGGMGDDIIHGMAGNDVIYGNGHDDDLIGGTGHDKMFGGSGEDGMLGDDGLLLTARNGVGETLYGLQPTVQTTISLPGPFTGAVVDIDGRLKKTAVILESDTLQLDRLDGVDLLALPYNIRGYHDVMYGGLGDDWMHGGYGDDAMSGAEALPQFFFDTRPLTDTPPIAYDPETGILEYYDPLNPLAKIDGFFLNFETFDANGEIIEDGKDNLFGDSGNDWLVGGTGHDRLFGGAGDDYLQGDDYLDTNGGANTDADPAAWGDFLVGGAGRDVLIANSGYDRMFDWTGEYNSFLVPFSQFGLPTIYRVPSPLVIQFLTDLAAAGGADMTLPAPNDEPALVTQQDDAWQDQTGAPRDPQPGNGSGLYDGQGGPEDDTDKITTIHGSTPAGRPPLFFPDPDASGDALLVRESDLGTIASAIGTVQFTAAGGIEGIVFSSDTSGIAVAGLDDAAALTWTVSDDGRTLTGTLDGGPDVLRIELLGGDSIAAGETGELTVVVTLLAAMPHEDDPNADLLTVSGLLIIAEDLAEGTLETTLSVVVLDDRPAVAIQPAVADATPWFDGLMPGETISGGWTLAEGADTAAVVVRVGGQIYALDDAIAIEGGDGTPLGVLTVHSDGSWSFAADAGLSGATQVNFTFELVATDLDGDSAVARHDIGIGGDLIPTPDPDPGTDPDGDQANNGVGNGVDPQPPGNPPVNDDIPDTPGDPGNKGGPSEWDEVVQDFGTTSDPSTDQRIILAYDDLSGDMTALAVEDDPVEIIEPAIIVDMGLSNDWKVKGKTSGTGKRG